MLRLETQDLRTRLYVMPGIEYMRIDGYPEHPDQALSGKTIPLAPGGMLDVVVDKYGAMGMDKVGYTPGLYAQRKVGADRITYRFSVKREALFGTVYTVQCRGEHGFSFDIKVGPS